MVTRKLPYLAGSRKTKILDTSDDPIEVLDLDIGEGSDDRIEFDQYEGGQIYESIEREIEINELLDETEFPEYDLED